MTALRTLLCLLFAGTTALWLPASAQILPGAPATAANSATPATPPPRGVWLPGNRTYLGLDVSRSRSGLACSSIALTCDDSERPAQFYTGTMLGNFWRVELSYLGKGRTAWAPGDTRAQGLTLSLVGKTQLAPSMGLFGRLGTTYGRSAAPLGAAGVASGAERGSGLSFGAGLSLDFTPALSATLQWDSTDVPLAGGGRDPVRSTSLGLKYRY